MALLNKVLNIPIRQEEVDFVIPDIHNDRRLGIDPFLFYRSTNDSFKHVHDLILGYFGHVLHLIAEGDISNVEYLLQFPEPNEICLGYSQKGIAGTGVGPELGKEIFALFRNSPQLLQRGLKHMEELQLICPGIGPDRISDITANIIKRYLIDYTQQQCKVWEIPMTIAVPVYHYFDFDSMAWHDGYFDLPLNPATGAPILFVPRRVLRILPWINYDEYVMEYKQFFLKSKKSADKLRYKQKKKIKDYSIEKNEVCDYSVENTEIIDAYIERKERGAFKALPDELLIMNDLSSLRESADRLQKELKLLKPGKADAYVYQDLMHRILTFCFHPHLVDGRPQQRTVGGTLIRDLIFLNEGTRNFWRYIQQTYGSLHVIFELKNTENISNGDVDQLVTYLGDPMGRFGVLVSRGDDREKSFDRRKVIYNKEVPRKVILHVVEQDIYNLLATSGNMQDTTAYIQNLYRDFITKLE